jgi:hypothetical protein
LISGTSCRLPFSVSIFMLAAAAHGRASIIVTLNLRHFSVSKLCTFSISVAVPHGYPNDLERRMKSGIPPWLLQLVSEQSCVHD